MSEIKFTPGASLDLDASEGIREALRIIGADADRRVPVGDGKFSGAGDLRDSQVQKVVGNTGGIGYTDRGAIPAHERLDVQPAGGRQRKYLEAALLAKRGAVLDAIADDLRKRFQ